MHEWWPDEIDYAGPEHLDDAYVAGYDAKAQFDPTDDITALVARDMDHAARVVDLGAGTGTFTLAVAPEVASVIAVDPSPAMAAIIRRRVSAAELDNVTVVEGGFLTYRHAGAPADAVYTRNALHQLPDFWKAMALQRLHDLMGKGSILYLRDLVYDFAPADATDTLEAWMAGAADDPARGYTASDLAHHVRTEFSTFSWVLEAMLERTGFTIEERTFGRNIYAAYICRRR
ncbi:MAG: class I SAM-dependent methyltransferase [Acidimicrobiia bacterium]|nr:class I SAM-dependent methyltransferase [Acidimicrobiia bacterium]MDH5237394.1 class I SAM-dependent methyltransferase [Acidimicrobiia bacterium]